ncbi:MAG TPA: DUF1674 domain-containing protein [Rhizomicrobium sp.]|nr:DUF1674 domain-containing protein [Rhizomicrobium sp.]
MVEDRNPSAEEIAERIRQAARRALAEAEVRRRSERRQERPREIGGRSGPEPTRYGDWEKNGLISDF